jgi:hypothetical protein
MFISCFVHSEDVSVQVIELYLLTEERQLTSELPLS